MLDKVLKDLKKKGQKSSIQNSVGGSMKQKASSNRSKAETDGEAELSTVKTSLTNVSENIGSSVKGQFGKQVKEKFKTQSEELQSF